MTPFTKFTATSVGVLAICSLSLSLLSSPCSAASVSAVSLAAKDKSASKAEKGYVFTVDCQVPTTSVKDQAASGTCWSFAALAYLESELLRHAKGEYDLSEMWISRHVYFDKAVKYARLHGSLNLAAGGAMHDVFNVIDTYGIVPEEAYTGLNYGTDKHRHGEIDATVKAYMDAIIANPNKQLSTAWQVGLNGILDAYYGAIPETFVYQGVTYTPRSFADSLGLVDVNTHNVGISSFTHHPMGQRFILEVPDNWAWGEYFNVPIDSLEAATDRALDAGISVLWSADVSEPGFSYNKGIAVMPIINSTDMDDSEKAKWSELTPEERGVNAQKFLEGPVPEITVNQTNRQQWFDNYLTTDDHGMLITGRGHDQNGTKYYKVKNSWGTAGLYQGYLWVSASFLRGKTLNIVIPAQAAML